MIANHLLVSFHVAFISSVLAIAAEGATRAEVLRFIFVSPETLVSALFVWLTFHTGVAVHELGHFLTAARLRALNDALVEEAAARLRAPLVQRALWIAKLFLLAPYGRAPGIKRQGLNYYPDAPYNLAVAAAGPRASRNLALVALPPAVLLLAAGLLTGALLPLYAGRLLLGLGVVGLLDFLLADPGKYREFSARERRARDSAATVEHGSDWSAAAPEVKRRLVATRMQEAMHPRLGPVRSPWQLRNCGMGGRHTEKEYPESNVSLQEAMFLILGASSAQESQEMTVRLQGRLKELIEGQEGCRVMGIGLEGGLAPFVDRGEHALPELRLWALMKRAIEECGYRPGVDVALALDPAASEAEIAYRDEFDVPDAVGMYLFWRDQGRAVLDREALLDLYVRAIEELDIPVLSIEDGFAEDDFEGWRMLLERLGDRLLVIGDDLVTTNDLTIETCAAKGLINTVLVKANQIGSLYETLLAVLTTLGKGLDVVVSHRSKSPNDDMEAHIALACNALGLKCGGGSNTERLVKYQAVSSLMRKVEERADGEGPREPPRALVRRLSAYEEPTNAGIPTVGVEAELFLPEAGVAMTFRGATPLGTSAGTGEAVHLVDRCIERAEWREVVERHGALFAELEPGVVAFERGLEAGRVAAAGDPQLTELWDRARRYEGMGCLNAVDNVGELVAPRFVGRDASSLSLLEIDRALLGIELATARRRGKLSADAPRDEVVRVMQRKQNVGMNALLSVSLALGRAVAHVRGKELYELLREEMIAIVERVAEEHGVSIPGGRFEDYVTALRQVDRRLAQEGRPLHEELRRATGLYDESVAVPAPPEVPEPEPAPEPEPELAAVALGGSPPPQAPRRASSAAPAAAEVASASDWESAPDPLQADEQARMEALDRALHRAWAAGGDAGRREEALRLYLDVKSDLARRLRRFEIANNRVFASDGRLLVPYRADDTLVLRSVGPATAQTILRRAVPRGRILTDRSVLELAGLDGRPVDLEREIFEFDPARAPEVRIERIRDLVALIERLNSCGSRQEAVFHLRFAVARLCSLSFKGFLGAKNLQPELRRLSKALAELLDGPFAYRLRMPMRVLVRNVSGLVSRPKLIDELWKDTIDLAEVHVRGSALTNELRRSTHHAMGRATLRLAQAYERYLESGEVRGLPDPGPAALSAVDEEARSRDAPREVCARIVANLERILGGSQIATRLEEWRQSYREALLRCESEASLESELEALVVGGARERNRWVWRRHLRVLAAKARDGIWSTDAGRQLSLSIADLERLEPSAPGFDPEAAEREARAAVSAFVDRLVAEYADPVFLELDLVSKLHAQGQFLATFRALGTLRRRLDRRLAECAFPEQRYLLHQLDCLLEEMGFLSLRHVASSYEEHGVRLRECLEIVHGCAANLGHDGLFSRELWDLTSMLVDPARSEDELADVLAAVQRNYHRLFQRVSVAYESMGERLGLDRDELRAMLGNFQRYLHDLNSLVHFIDLARRQLQEAGLPDQPDLDGRAPEPDPWDVLHLSHVEELTRRIESWDPALDLLGRYGGKGSGLAYFAYLRVPTRDGFVLPATIPRLGLHATDPRRLEAEVERHLRVLEADVSRARGEPRRFGDPRRPLLLAVRGGSCFSMPGLLSTVVFVGINDAIAAALAEDEPWHAYDAYRRFLGSYAQAAWGIDVERFDLVEEAKSRHGVAFKTELPGEAMREIAEGTKAALGRLGKGRELEALLEDPLRQLQGAVQAVFASWDGDRARRYRSVVGLADSWQTAVVVQQMASGNRPNREIRPGMDETQASLTGVIPCTRMTEWGFRTFTGDVKFSASGDDLVGGLTAATSFQPVEQLGTHLPMLDRMLHHIDDRIRRFRGTDPEIEFTVDRGELSVLQARMALSAVDLDVRSFAGGEPPAARGIGIRGGAFRGLVAFGEDDVEALRDEAHRRQDADGVLLVLENPTPDEIPLLLAADGLLTVRGGSTSHAAVAVHGVEGRLYTAVFGVDQLRVDASLGEARLPGGDGADARVVRRGEVLSIHGTSGEVFAGARNLAPA